MRENFNFLTTAIASLENSFHIYEQRDMIREYSKNHYGMALSLFSQGYAYS